MCMFQSRSLQKNIFVSDKVYNQWSGNLINIIAELKRYQRSL
jgi:hypothetical protein